MRVLFVCTGNTGRSMMAERIFNHLVDAHEAEQWKSMEAISAGIDAAEGDSPEEYAIDALRERGITVTDHRARKVTPELLDSVDIILTMGQRHKKRVLMMNSATQRDLNGRVFLLTEFVGEQGDIIDCYGHDMAFYRECVNRLFLLIGRTISRLLEETIE